MYENYLSKDEFVQIQAFHGHLCKGLVLGIRVAALAKKLLNNSQNLSVVSETDMCGFDAISFMLPVTYGKGNLIHLDYGKNAFSFYDHDTKKAYRIKIKNSFFAMNVKLEEVFSLPDNKILEYEEIAYIPPRPARVLNSLVCASCDEMTMETRVRIYEGKHYCLPCFATLEQKI